MKYFSLFCLTVAAALLQGSGADTEIAAREEGAPLDEIFDDIIANVQNYVKNTTYGSNLVTFFKAMKTGLSKMTIKTISDDFEGKGSLFDQIWDDIYSSAVVAFKGTALPDVSIKVFLDTFKASVDFFDLVHLIIGPQKKVLDKVRLAIDAAAIAGKVKQEEVKKFTNLIDAITDGFTKQRNTH